MICGARSLPALAAYPDSEFICTRDPGHKPADRHSACTGQGFIVARWSDEDRYPEVFLPLMVFPASLR